ncbi:MAG: hypothetical protein RML32_09810, partial [Gammaproteobacteria bacterium]|nr:hypothetical protein [Gammaproteobacteria bacterium]
MGVLLDIALRAGTQAEPKTAPPQDRGDREAKRRELERLIRLLAEHDPAHWSDDDIREALEAGEQDLDAAIETWRNLCAQRSSALDDQPNAQAEARRRRVLQMLRERPSVR